ncbi:CHAD domain-containing protein [Paenalcaligenes hominis]|uniref:CHAD domain-containing protein n=1 Tax=Paenalcaligenes hominis TaxID=643674 RepID=A0ABX0WSJ0_9BURK|nr:CYTH and CHAD domain-containing protein [Paenalcaligenes hominis]NJB65730.1 CHAD domain-containing protein [Paenalcaligenes hominis]GGE63448.1 inorganic triphosphatase [Paenalcaligenes hominis]
MLERELKLYVPTAQQAAVNQLMTLIKNQAPERLAARYFDTPQRDLARQHAALRLRREGEQWVQTLKLRAQDELSVIEFNHVRPEPVLDLNLYHGTAAEALFVALTTPLDLRYQTEVLRTTALVNHQGSTIEIAWDVGQIQAKNHSLPISEVEFELKSGDVKAIFQLGAQWLKVLPLLIELRSKSERGDALYENTSFDMPSLSGAEAARAIAGQPYRLGQTPTVSQIELSPLYHQSSQRFLAQIIRNAAFLAGVDEIHVSETLQADYLTLMRVGMRRLRSCRQLFQPWLRKSEKKHATLLLKHYRKFGRWRDKDMLWLELQPKIIAAGLPAAKKLAPPKRVKRNPRRLAADSAFQLLLLDNLKCLVLEKGLKKQAIKPENNARLARRLEQSWTGIQTLCTQFESLEPVDHHYLRNQIKRLRYNLEALGYDESTKLYVYLAKAQDHLGDLCDAYVAQDWYSEQAATPEQKQFALDWLQKKIHKYQAKCKKTLHSLQAQRLKLQQEN